MPRCPTCHRRIPEATPCPADGAIAPRWAVPDDVANAKPPTIAGFTIQDQLGMGGFSVVWKAIREPEAVRPTSDGPPPSARRFLAAIKVSRGDSPIIAERFRRDAEALGQIGPPSAPRLYGHGRLDDGRPYIAMELLAGKPLADRLEALPAPPDAGWIARVAVAILDAIGAAHARGFLHRDLKPENIFLDDAGRRATLIDFGLTKSAPGSEASSITRTGTVVGTPEYMAPEQIRGDSSIDARADIYAFGVILYELCTLRVPFAGDRASIEHGHVALRPPRPREFVAIPEALEELILACLAKEPARRPADVGAIRRVLLEAVPSGPASSTAFPRTSPSTAPPPGSRPSSSKARLLSEARRPMVILVVETNAAALPVSSTVSRYGGFIARQRAASYVCVFSGIDVEDPAQAGIAAAREMVGRFGARAALHLAALAMRRQESSPPAVYGAPVERPETWMPSIEGWSGVLLTAELARVVPENELGLAAENAAFIPLAPSAPMSDGAHSLPWDTDPLSMSGVLPRSSGPTTEPAGLRSSRGRSLSSPALASMSPTPPSVTSIDSPGVTPQASPAVSPTSPPGSGSSSPSDPGSQAAWSKPWSPMTQPSPEGPATQVTLAPPLTQRSPRTLPPAVAPPSEPDGLTPSSEPMTQPSMMNLTWEREPANRGGGDTDAPPGHLSGTRERLPSSGESAVRLANARYRRSPTEAPDAAAPSSSALTDLEPDLRQHGGDRAAVEPFSGLLDRPGPPVPSSTFGGHLTPSSALGPSVPWSGPRTQPLSESPADRMDALESLRRLPSGVPSAPSPSLLEGPGTLRPSEPMTQPSGPPSGAARPPTGPVNLSQRIPLFGRDDVIDSMRASASASFDGSCPGLFTLLGDSGLGKTRLAGEALGLVDRLRPGAAVIFQRAAQPLADAAGQTTRELLGRVLGVANGEPVSGGKGTPTFVPPPDARAFCRGRLGEELGEETWRAVAVTLGWSTGEALSVSPGAIQRGAMLALTEGLRRLARSGPVVLVLDDAHWADDTALDALEYATLNAEGCPLWVLVAAHPRFENVRRGWGTRAQRHDRWVLGALEEVAAMQLAAELLLPAEYPPAATLKRLSDWAGGNPACLAELSRTLKRAGIVRQRPNLGTWYVATAELDRLPPSTAWQWLAVRQLDGLQPELAACVRLCSVMGVEFTRTGVEWVQDAMEREGVAVTPIDMGVGLGALVEKRILLRGSGDRYSFQSSTFQDAVYKLLDASHREKIHRFALQFLRTQQAEGEDSLGILERLARHAGACGARDEAAEAYLALGDAAGGHHKHVEADQHYTSALMFLAEDDTRRRALALAGRGKSRYRVHRSREALDDLREARGLGESLGDNPLTADILLEEATALDFASDFDESARRVENARALVETLDDRRLELRFWAALGRSYFHQERTTEALDLLRRSADGAKETGDYETRVIALLLLAPSLVSEGKLDEADQRFQEVLTLCTEAEDWLHLGAAYANRAYLWAVRKLRERSMDDLRRSIQLAREVGNPLWECVATNNVAEFLHWLGEEDEALVMVRRVRVLEERFMDKPVSDGSLLLARIQAARGEFNEANQCIQWIGQNCRPADSAPTHQAFWGMMHLVLEHLGMIQAEREQSSWGGIVEKANGGIFTEELLEVLYWRARVALGLERWDEASEALRLAEERLEECPMWPLRFANLKTRLLIRQPVSMPLESRTADDTASGY